MGGGRWARVAHALGIGWVKEDGVRWGRSGWGYSRPEYRVGWKVEWGGGIRLGLITRALGTGWGGRVGRVGG